MACLFGKRDDELIQTHGGIEQRSEHWKPNTTKTDRELKGQDKKEQRPITCQLYPGLSAKKLYNFLQTKSASKPCMLYYLRKLQNVKPNYIRDYLDRNGTPFPYMDKDTHHDHDCSNNASFMSADWMSIVSHSSTLELHSSTLELHSSTLELHSSTLEFDKRNYYKIYYESQD